MNKPACIKFRNEVFLVGLLLAKQRNITCNNRKAIRLTLGMANDKEQYNIANVIIYDENNSIYESLKRKQSLTIKGHVECNYGQRIIVDEIHILKEPFLV